MSHRSWGARPAIARRSALLVEMLENRWCPSATEPEITAIIPPTTPDPTAPVITAPETTSTNQAPTEPTASSVQHDATGPNTSAIDAVFSGQDPNNGSTTPPPSNSSEPDAPPASNSNNGGNEDPSANGSNASDNGEANNGDPGNNNPADGDPGNDGSGDHNGTGADPGNNNPGSDPGNGDPGNGDPGNGDPGNGDPGNGDPGNGDPGNGDPGSNGSGDNNGAGNDPGNNNPGDGNPGNGNPGNGDPGNGNPGGDPGNNDPGNNDPGSNDPGNEAGWDTGPLRVTYTIYNTSDVDVVVRGTVKGQGAAGASVNFYGAFSETVTADSNGQFTFNEHLGALGVVTGTAYAADGGASEPVMQAIANNPPRLTTFSMRLEYGTNWRVYGDVVNETPNVRVQFSGLTSIEGRRLVTDMWGHFDFIVSFTEADYGVAVALATDTWGQTGSASYLFLGI